MNHQHYTTFCGMLLTTLVFWIAGAASVKADLNIYCIRSIEWLVDNSEVIAVVRESEDDERDEPTVLRTLKGDVSRIKWPLKKSPHDGLSYYGPPSDGPVRLVFVRGTSELLGGVKLGRWRYSRDAGKIYDVWYGVTQYGDLLLTESDMFRAIDAQLRVGPSQPIERKKDSLFYERSGIEAPRTFPLEDVNETYVLIVPFNVARRDHYLSVLRTGDAAERIHAIHELSQLIDQKSLDAIREATRCGNVMPAYEFRWSDRSVHELTANDVRRTVNAVLQGENARHARTTR
jgi:hypothetical protein